MSNDIHWEEENETVDDYGLFVTKEELDEFKDVCKQLVRGVGKAIHRDLSIDFTEDGGTYTVNGKDITLNTNFPICKDESDLFACLHHELAHIVFKSDMRYCKDLFKEFPNVNKDVIAQILNIIEDIRIEHAWGKLYPGHYKAFLSLRRNMQGDDVQDNPLWILLQIRAGNKEIDNLVEPKLLPFVKSVKSKLADVRNSSCMASVIVTKEIIELITDYYGNSTPCCLKCGKNMKEKEKDLTKTHYGAGVCTDCAEDGGCGGEGEESSDGKPSNDKSSDKKKEFTAKDLENMNNELEKAIDELKDKGWTLGCNNDEQTPSNEQAVPGCSLPFGRSRAGGTDKQVLENTKPLTRKHLTEEMRLAQRRNRNLMQKAIKHIGSLMSQQKNLKQQLKENLKDYGGESQHEIDQYSWNKSYEPSKPRLAWLGKVRALTGEQSYARKKKLHSTGYKIKMNKAVTYIASGMKASNRNIFLRKSNSGKSLSICFVVDMSSSMYGEDSRIVKELMLTTEEAVQSINAITTDYIVFESNVRARITDKKLLATVDAQGGTYCTPAVVHGANVLNHCHFGDEKVLLLLSDGGHENLERALDYCEERNITPFIICVSAMEEHWIKSLYGEKYVKNCITIDNYEEAVDEIMDWVLGKIKELLEKK